MRSFDVYFVAITSKQLNKLLSRQWFQCSVLLRKKYHCFAAEYFLGDRRMPLIPIMVSATVSYMSTITLLGYPAEMFAFGAQYWLGCISLTLGVIVAAVLFVPVFYPLKITSINEVRA